MEPHGPVFGRTGFIGDHTETKEYIVLLLS